MQRGRLLSWLPAAALVSIKGRKLGQDKGRVLHHGAMSNPLATTFGAAAGQQDRQPHNATGSVNKPFPLPQHTNLLFEASEALPRSNHQLLAICERAKEKRNYALACWAQNRRPMTTVSIGTLPSAGMQLPDAFTSPKLVISILVSELFFTALKSLFLMMERAGIAAVVCFSLESLLGLVQTAVLALVAAKSLWYGSISHLKTTRLFGWVWIIAIISAELFSVLTEGVLIHRKLRGKAEVDGEGRGRKRKKMRIILRWAGFAWGLGSILFAFVRTMNKVKSYSTPLSWLVDDEGIKVVVLYSLAICFLFMTVLLAHCAPSHRRTRANLAIFSTTCICLVSWVYATFELVAEGTNSSDDGFDVDFSFTMETSAGVLVAILATVFISVSTWGMPDFSVEHRLKPSPCRGYRVVGIGVDRSYSRYWLHRHYGSGFQPSHRDDTSAVFGYHNSRHLAIHNIPV